MSLRKLPLRSAVPDALHRSGRCQYLDQDLLGAGWRLRLAGGDGFWGAMISTLLVLYATTHQITLAGPALVTTVVGVAIFLVSVLLSPETKGKVLLGELTVA
jgi:hypothetical protein